MLMRDNRGIKEQLRVRLMRLIRDRVEIEQFTSLTRFYRHFSAPVTREQVTYRRAKVFVARYKRPRIIECTIMSGSLSELADCASSDSLLQRLLLEQRDVSLNRTGL